LHTPSRRRIGSPLTGPAPAEQAADLGGGHQPRRAHGHHDDHDGGERHVAPIGARAQNLGQQREHGGAERRTEHGLRAAEQRVEHDGDAERNVEILRLDETEMMGVKPAADRGDDRSEHERRDLEGAHVDAHEVGNLLVVVHGGHRDAEPRREQQPHDREDGDGEQRNDRKADEGRDRISGRAADDFEVEDDRLDDLAQRKRGEREIDPARAQDRHGDGQRHQPGRDPGRRNRKQRREQINVAQVGGRIGADRREPGEAEVELSGRERQEGPIGEHHVYRQQHQHTFEISAHARAEAMVAANRPVGRSTRMSNSRP
jgi:hypothetical protein